MADGLGRWYNGLRRITWAGRQASRLASEPALPPNP